VTAARRIANAPPRAGGRNAEFDRLAILDRPGTEVADFHPEIIARDFDALRNRSLDMARRLNGGTLKP
jgi:hypothetical protein